MRPQDIEKLANSVVAALSAPVRATAACGCLSDSQGFTCPSGIAAFSCTSSYACGGASPFECYCSFSCDARFSCSGTYIGVPS